jgi:hypothetical protein
MKFVATAIHFCSRDAEKVEFGLNSPTHFISGQKAEITTLRWTREPADEEPPPLRKRREDERQQKHEPFYDDIHLCV